MANPRENIKSDVSANLKAEVVSALALLEDLSTKSSDSGLSEDTCWELFGGPCPEALRKKIQSVKQDTPLEEEEDSYSVSEVSPIQDMENFEKKNDQIEVPQHKKDLEKKDDQIKEETTVHDTYTKADRLKTEPLGNSSTGEKVFHTSSRSNESKLSKEMSATKGIKNFEKENDQTKVPSIQSKEHFEKKHDQVREEITVQDTHTKDNRLEKEFQENNAIGEKVVHTSNISNENKLSKKLSSTKSTKSFEKKNDQINRPSLQSKEHFKNNDDQVKEKTTVQDIHTKADRLGKESQGNSSTGEKVLHKSNMFNENKLPKDNKLPKITNGTKDSKEKSPNNSLERGISKADSLENELPKAIYKRGKPSYRSKESNEDKLLNKSRIQNSKTNEKNESKVNYHNESQVATASTQVNQKNKNDLKNMGTKNSESKEKENHKMLNKNLSDNQVKNENVSPKDLDKLIDDTHKIKMHEKSQSTFKNKNKSNELSNDKSIETHNYIYFSPTDSPVANQRTDSFQSKYSKLKSDSIGTPFIPEPENNMKKTSMGQAREESSMKMLVGSEENPISINNSLHTSISKINTISTSISSIVRDKKTESRHYSMSETNISSSETLFSNGSKGKLHTLNSRNLKGCNCVCCVDRQIRKSHKKEVLRCNCCNKDRDPICCQHCGESPTLLDKNYQVKIYNEDTSSHETQSFKKIAQITSFDDNKTVCCKRVQTSMANIYNDNRGRCLCIHNDPLCLYPGFSPPMYPNKSRKSSPAKRRTADKKVCRCSGDFKQKSINLPQSPENSISDDESECPSITSYKCNVAHSKEHRSFKDSLKDALLKKSVKETVKSFENKNKYSLLMYTESSDDRDYNQPMRKQKNTNYKDKKYSPVTPRNEMGGCCSNPKKITKKRPNVPGTPCVCCNYRKYYQ